MTDKQACTLCGVDGHSLRACPTQPCSNAATERHYPGCQAARRRIASGELSPMCATCNDNGRIGGPSFYAPDEGGEPRPDCAQPSPAPELELLRSALSHIIKTCNQSRTETRRLRWIAQRAQWALEGKKYDISAFDLPKYSATAKERLEREVKILREQVAQTGQVPQAWLDVQAERRRQIEEDGWIPELNEQHKAGELARAAAAYLLYAYPRVPFDVTLAARLWPWVSGFNPKGVRQVLVRACSLVLGELDGLDHTAELAEGSPVDESPVINNSLGSHSGTKHRQSEVEQPTQELTTLRSTVAIAPELLQRVVDHLEWEGKPETTAYEYVSRGDRLAEELRTEIGDAPETVEHDIQG